MSGSAALSAARKRRASTAPSGGGASAIGPAPTAYYGRGAAGPKEATNFIQQPNSGNAGALPPQPMNIYENIEMIKHQLTERTKLIQMQGSSMPPEKVRVLQKQNEIQTQILKQKMAIAAQMESENQSRGPPAHIQEPEFLYEKGVPRKNPNYRDPNQVGRAMHVSAPVPVPVPVPVHASKQPHATATATATQLSPFVSMLSDTGVIPPPVVVLKSHDIKLQEHNDILHDIVHELDDLRASMTAVARGQSGSGSLPAIKEESRNYSRDTSRAEAEAEAEAEPEEEEELLMEVVMNDLTNSREFVEGIVNKIVNETNLSEVIMKIEPLVKENQELRSLIHSQQQMMNEMNTMLLRLLNGGGAGAGVGGSNTPDRETVVDGDGLFPSCEMTEIILSGTNDHVESSSDVNAEAAEAAEAEDEVVAADEEEEEAEEADEAADEAAEAADEESHEAAAAAAEAEEIHESNETRTLEPTDCTYDEYEKRHFIEPISLVVSEL